MRPLFKSCYLVIGIFLIAVNFSASAAKYPKLKTPYGESIKSSRFIADNFHGKRNVHVATDKRIYSINGKTWTDTLLNFYAPNGQTIVDVWQGKYTNPAKPVYYVNTSEGDLYRIDQKGKRKLGAFPGNSRGIEVGVIVASDYIYSYTGETLYLSYDSGKSWVTDTVGIASFNKYEGLFTEVYGMEMDSFQNVYVATNHGFYKQEHNSLKWRSIAFPGGDAEFLYISRKGNFYVSDNYNFYISKDTGASFSLFSSGLEDSAAVLNAGEDVYGNLYVITLRRFGNFYLYDDKEGMYRSNAGTSAFVEIDSLIKIEQIDKGRMFRAIGGDSLLYAGTSLGVFVSADKGATWKEANEGIISDENTCLVKTASGGFVISTALGVYAKNPTDSSWSRTFPDSGYISDLPVFADNTGIIYTCRERLGNYWLGNGPRMVYKSNDNGKTWQADTLGIQAMFDNAGPGWWDWYVDERGIQHADRWFNFSPYFGTMLFVKYPGKSWQVDIKGYNVSWEDHIVGWASNGKGTVYMKVASNYRMQVWQRDSTGLWHMDSTGLIWGVEPLGKLNDGTMLTGGYLNLYRENKTANGWDTIAMPANTYGDYFCSAINGDRFGGIWTAFQDYNANSTMVGTDVYYSQDTGKTWIAKGLDSIYFDNFSPLGDSVLGISHYDGIYVFTAPRITGIKEKLKTANAPIRIYPNPAYNSLDIEIPSIKNERTIIELINSQGILTRSLFTSENHTELELSGMAPGFYFIRIINSEGVISQPFVKR